MSGSDLPRELHAQMGIRWLQGQPQVVKWLHRQLGVAKKPWECPKLVRWLQEWPLASKEKQKMARAAAELQETPRVVSEPPGAKVYGVAK